MNLPNKLIVPAQHLNGLKNFNICGFLKKNVEHISENDEKESIYQTNDARSKLFDKFYALDDNE